MTYGNNVEGRLVALERWQSVQIIRDTVMVTEFNSKLATINTNVLAAHRAVTNLRGDIGDVEKRSVISRLISADVEMKSFRREMSEEIGSLKSDVSELKGRVGTLEADVATLKTDVAILKTDMAVVKAKVSALETDVRILKADVAELKSDVAELKTEVATLNVGVGQILQLLREGRR
ncbi:hypothetical protein [Nocardia lijiangensis]|uniref:hypothetical protein n=1 Tax=Nocardia lijiangensis TaxID=299618 RepID=UPI0008323B99|nr:hypothetical protein [Nocardia lijiangensis]